MAADNNIGQNSAVWPTPKFYFKVDFGNGISDVPFQEVSGLDTEPQTIEYRNANSAVFNIVKMPGIKKYGNVTLKKGIFARDNNFWDWHNQLKMNTMARHTATIKLMDEEGKTVMQWQLINSWPTKLTGTDFKDDGNEVAVESVELAHEGINVIGS